MEIQKIYEKYKIMPQLQLHQLRVAGVASIICGNFQKEIDKESVVTATLLHDMGNVIKFSLSLYPENLKPKGLEYWENVKAGFIKKYGSDEHKATYKIANEIGVNKETIEIIKGVGFSQSEKIFYSTNYGLKIASYSDQRVTPFGIEKLEKRLDEGIARNKKRLGKTYDSNFFNKMKNFWIKIEKQIFYHAKISPEDITDRGVIHLIPKLREYEIKTI